MTRLRVFLFALLFQAHAFAADETPPPLLLISLDGFRWDYCALHPAESPHLRQLMKEGASARGLIPVFPSNTFPNHYSIVTGLYPAHHGIINNHIFDPAYQEYFHYNQPASAHDKRWWGGEPIWVTAVKQGRKSACYFWPGDEVEIAGGRPTYWKPFDLRIPFETRLAELDRWLRLPANERPCFITFYMEETNSVGHANGPDSPQIAEAIKLLDGRVGAIVDLLKAENLAVNVIVVSDHGMTSLSPDRVVILDDYLDPSTVQLEFGGSVVGLRPLDGQVEPIMHALATLPPHAKAFRAADLPARFHLSGNPRIPPVWILPDEGWHVDTRGFFNATRNKYMKGDHGYDPALTSMRGILIAHGPSFKTGGIVIDPVENIHIYNLMCAALKLKPAPNDGDDRLVRAFLK